MKVKIIDALTTTVTEVPVQVLTFSGGEQHVKLDTSELDVNLFFPGRSIRIEHEIRSSTDLMTLVMVKNAIDNHTKFTNPRIDLVMFYLPYARQDRVCDKGEAFGLKAFADILNSLNFSRVVIADPHSDVSGALIKNMDVIEQHDIAFHALKWKLRMEEFALISPDAGALKKIFKLGKMMELEVHCAEKIRDTKTGDIIKTNINVEDFNGKNLMIVDDICDNGGTFLALGKALKERNAGKVELYVTHGIFGKGIDIFDGIIDKIHCFNAWENNVVGRNTKGILVENQAVLQKLVVK